MPLASTCQHPENKKENQAGHSPERTAEGQSSRAGISALWRSHSKVLVKLSNALWRSHSKVLVKLSNGSATTFFCLSALSHERIQEENELIVARQREINICGNFERKNRGFAPQNTVFCAARAAIERHLKRFSRFGGENPAVFNGACSNCFSRSAKKKREFPL